MEQRIGRRLNFRELETVDIDLDALRAALRASREPTEEPDEAQVINIDSRRGHAAKEKKRHVA